MENVVNTKSKIGILKLSFPGQWFLFDANAKISVDGKRYAAQSIKHGFALNIPITTSYLDIKVAVLWGLRSTTYKLRDLQPGLNYAMKLDYNEKSGKFSKNYQVLACDEGEILITEAEAVANTKSKSTKKRNLLTAIFTFLVLWGLVKFLNGESAGQVYGRYFYEAPKGSYVASGGTNNFIELYENSEVRLHIESNQFGVSNRWGRFSLNEDKTAIEIYFNDGLPEMGILDLQKDGGNWRILNGSSLYVKDKKAHEDNFKEPLR